MEYDKADPQSIERYAQRLLGKSLRQYLGEIGQDVESHKEGKGRLGQIVEEEFFHYQNNSTAGPDFAEAGVELKTTPMKAVKRGDGREWVPKERLVLNIINYMEEGLLDAFEESSFWNKNRLLLLMFYLYEEGKDCLDLVFYIIRLWEFSSSDLSIIKEDWEIIHGKIKAGCAHEITEGDTRYLAACTKGSSASIRRQQPFSNELAKQRAYSLKTCYVRTIIDISLKEQERKGGAKKDGAATESDYQSLYALPCYNEKLSFEQNVEHFLSRFYGMAENEIWAKLGDTPVAAKHKYAVLVRRMLGITKDRIEEFEKAGVEIKTVNLESNGTLKEAMSFRNIDYKGIIQEEWEESYWYDVLSHKFLFVVFQKREDGSSSVFKVAFFWNMPSKDLEMAAEFWEHTKQRIVEDDFSHFIKASDKLICHVRPHGRNAQDLVETATGRMEKKYSYWLNRDYVLSVVRSHLD